MDSKVVYLVVTEEFYSEGRKVFLSFEDAVKYAKSLKLDTLIEKWDLETLESSCCEF